MRAVRFTRFFTIKLCCSREIFLNAYIQTTMDMNVLVPVVLFVLLSPGVLLSLPPGQSHLVQVVTHAVVFGAVYMGLRMTFPQYY